MTGILHDKIVFGPINSRRLGKSLGINLLPQDIKICTMNCIYCECGWAKTDEIIYSKLLPASEIVPVIAARLQQMHNDHVLIDSITYSGNGEPCIHLQFGEITREIIRLRNQYFPQTVITCLSNSTQLHRKDVVDALKAIDHRMMKLDAGTQAMFEQINKPFKHLKLDDVCDNLRQFNGDLSIQTLLLKGTLDNGELIDNTTSEEITAWLQRLRYIKPQKVILYSIDRETPAKKLIKIDKETLFNIANRVEKIGIKAEVY
ncbi:MAG: radical SAM protein [Bacteroidales bacterium]|nr:radical SAM protein [Bacteroidales bacterium]